MFSDNIYHYKTYARKYIISVPRVNRHCTLFGQIHLNPTYSLPCSVSIFIDH